MRTSIVSFKSEIPTIEEIEQQVEKTREIIKVIKGMEASGELQLEQEAEIKPLPGPSLVEIMYVLLKIEERLERVEQKLDKLITK